MRTWMAAWSFPLLASISLQGTPPAHAQLLGHEVQKQLLELDFETVRRRAKEAPPGEDLLPDLIVSQEHLRDLRVDVQRTPLSYRVDLRLSFGAVNIGRGPLELEGGEATGSKRKVRQIVYRTDGRLHMRHAGDFIHHPEHRHVHFQNWAHWRLREVTQDEGIGAVLAEGQKTSFCVGDLEARLRGLAGFNPRQQYRDCDMNRQGLSVGWADIYDKSLHGQWLDITRLEPGAYWLEAEVDPDNLILESDEGNNVARIKIICTMPDGVRHVTVARPQPARAGDSARDSNVDPTPERVLSRAQRGYWLEGGAASPSANPWPAMLAP